MEADRSFRTAVNPLRCAVHAPRKPRVTVVLTSGGPAGSLALPARPEVEPHCAKFNYPKIAIRSSRGFNPHEK